MTRQTLATRTAIVLSALLVALSLLLAAWPMQAAKPLIAKGDWNIEGQAFQNVAPQLFEVRESIRTSPETVYWRTWSPETQATKANITTKPFTPSRYMAIPYGGFAGATGIGLSLRCSATGHELSVATARTNTQMTEAFVKIPANWCVGSVELEAVSQSTSNYIEVGTPFEIAWTDYYKNSFIGLFGLFVVIFSFAWGLVLLPDIIAILRGKDLNSIVAGMSCLGLVGYGMFFVYFFSHHAGNFISASLFILELWLVFTLYTRHRNVLPVAWGRWKTPTILWFVVALSAFCLAMATNNGAGPWTVNALFKPVRWSSDNQLPMQISEYLFHGIDPRTLSLGPWKISDRPPLAYGLMSCFRLLSWLVASHSDGSPLFYQYELISGIVINGLWVVALYYLLSALGLKRRDICWITLVIGLTPFAIFNSVYIWPKMLGAAFGLLAFTLLFEPEQYMDNQRHMRFGSALIWAALLSALALMSHGGTVFGVIAAILVSIWYRGLPVPRLAIRATLVGLLVLMPWALWQHAEQPPGNALVKYAFSGNFGFGEESKGVLATIQDAYAKLTFSSWLDMKLNALNVLITGVGSTCGVQEIAPISSYYGLLRSQDFFYLGPSLRFLAAGFIPLAFGFGATRKEGRRNKHWVHFARIMVSTGFISIGLYTLFAFDCYINHTQSYQAMLEISAGLVLALHNVDRWYFTLILKLSVLYGIYVWMIDPILSADYTKTMPILMLCVISVAIYFKNQKMQSATC